MIKKWEFYNSDEKLVDEICERYNLNKVIGKIIVNRHVVNDEDVRIFITPTRDDFHNPFLFKGMDIAVDRIIKAINNKEKILIYGDYDVDGITSTTVLKKYLMDRGISVDTYIPNRLHEGYGLNKKAIDTIKERNIDLIITVDCGISAIEEVDYAVRLGMDIIVTDHHEVGEKLPNALAVIDAKRKDNTYPFRALAGVGVVFKLIQALSIKLEIKPEEYLKYLDLVCVGTISDIVPLEGENRTIAKLGLMLIKVTRNLGLRELIKSSGYKEIDSNTISFGVAPRINACGRMGHEEEALKLFLAEDLESATKITKELNEYNTLRQSTEKAIYEEAVQQIEKNINFKAKIKEMKYNDEQRYTISGLWITMCGYIVLMFIKEFLTGHYLIHISIDFLVAVFAFYITLHQFIKQYRIIKRYQLKIQSFSIQLIGVIVSIFVIVLTLKSPFDISFLIMVIAYITSQRIMKKEINLKRL